jgi:putative hydrolase of the HAD superfamily
MSAGNAIGTLIWDFDGTLGYRAGAWAGALLAALDGLMPGHALTAEALRRHLGTGFLWHRPAQGRAVPLDADAWWAALHPVFAGVYAACGIPSAASSRASSRNAGSRAAEGCSSLRIDSGDSVLVSLFVR